MSEPGHYIKPPFTDEQLAHLEKMFNTLGLEVEQRASSHYCRNDAAQEAVQNVSHALQCFQPQYIEP